LTLVVPRGMNCVHMPVPHPEHFDAPPAASFEALFRAHHAALCTFAYRYVLARDIAEELVQEVFLYLWEHEMAWDDPHRAKAYLFTAVRNAALSYLRHEGVAQRSEGEIVALYAGQATATPDRELRTTELAQALQRAVAQLPERRRLVFTLSREQGLTYAEIAQVLSISVKTVEMQMGRAYRALRRQLAPYWP
jgi:RNA polymerase sigma-70 factor (ECF subfamily)